MQHFSSLVWRIAVSDLALLRRFPRYALAVLAIAVVPALYALIYLTSVWDPNANTRALPVAIVNLDAGLQYQGRTVNVGAELTRGLVDTARFGFRTLASAADARAQVQRGALAFAIVIPTDFSANAVPGVQPGAGKVTVILSEGNNYASAGFARRFAEDLGHQANEILNEQRWEQVLASADGSGRSLDDLRAGMAQLRAGLQDLHGDVGRNTALAMRWAAGVRQADAALRRLEEKYPADTDLKPLRAGIQRLLQRQRELGAGLDQVRAAGDKSLAAASAAESEQPAAAVGGSGAAGTIEPGPAKSPLNEGLQASADASQRLGAGLARADARLGKLGDSMGAMGDGLRAIGADLQQVSALESPAVGGKALADAVERLRFGVDMAGSVLPASSGKPDGSARGLADSVEPVLEVLAPVANNGSAFAPNMVAMALWLGAVMVVYVFAMQTVTADQAGLPRSVLVLGKFAVPAATALVQVLLILLTLVWALGIRMAAPALFCAIAVVCAWAFLALVHVLVRAFGEAGKLLAVLLLTLQLAAGGGVLPIALSGGLFRVIHDWLPFTWAVRALRASLFGAFDNGWSQPTAIVAAAGVAALVLAAFVGRWRVVAVGTQAPPIDV